MPTFQLGKPGPKLFFSHAIARLKNIKNFCQNELSSRPIVDAGLDAEDSMALVRFASNSSSSSQQGPQIQPASPSNHGFDEPISWDRRKAGFKRPKIYFQKDISLPPQSLDSQKRPTTKASLQHLSQTSTSKMEVAQRTTSPDLYHALKEPEIVLSALPEQSKTDKHTSELIPSICDHSSTGQILVQWENRLQTDALKLLAASVIPPFTRFDLLTNVFCPHNSEADITQLCRDLRILVDGCSDSYFLPEIMHLWLSIEKTKRQTIRNILMSRERNGQSLLLLASDMDFLRRINDFEIDTLTLVSKNLDSFTRRFIRSNGRNDPNFSVKFGVDSLPLQQDTKVLPQGQDAFLELCKSIPRLGDLSRQNALTILLDFASPSEISALCFGLRPIVSKAYGQELFSNVIQCWIGMTAVQRSLAKELLQKEPKCSRSLKLILKELNVISASFATMHEIKDIRRKKLLLSFITNTSPLNADSYTYDLLQKIFFIYSTDDMPKDLTAVTQAAKDILKEIEMSVGKNLDGLNSQAWITIVNKLCSKKTQTLTEKKDEIIASLEFLGCQNDMKGCLALVDRILDDSTDSSDT